MMYNQIAIVNDSLLSQEYKTEYVKYSIIVNLRVTPHYTAMNA